MSAACVRTQSLIKGFQERIGCSSVVYISHKKRGPLADLAQSRYGIKAVHCTLNHEEGFLDAIGGPSQEKDIVLFDTFLLEEKFGWMVRRHLPNAMRIVDTQDLFFQRQSREQVALQSSLLYVPGVLNPPLLQQPTTRELASILRSDLSLIVSPTELKLLLSLQIPNSKLEHAGFFYANQGHRSSPFESRSNIVHVGNWKHGPNWDSVRHLKDKIWPSLRQHLPKGTQIHLYGSNPGPQHLQLTDTTSGFIVKGYSSKPIHHVLAPYRLLAAPLRYGAGIKGKIADAWSVGTPVVTTPIGAEGMTQGAAWGGSVVSSDEEYIQHCSHLYQHKSSWTESSKRGQSLLSTLFDESINMDHLFGRIQKELVQLQESRQKDWVSQILWTEEHNALEYKSRYIALRTNQNTFS